MKTGFNRVDGATSLSSLSSMMQFEKNGVFIVGEFKMKLLRLFGQLN